MAETEPMSSSSSMPLPPPPSTFAGAPGQQSSYDNGTSNGQGNPSHMPPPPLPPVVIPQNTNPIPTAMTSPSIDANGMMSPGSASSSFIRRAAPEPNKRALYVGGLDPRVTEDVLRQIFETTGHVQNVKIIPDKNVGAVSISLFCFLFLPATEFNPKSRILCFYGGEFIPAVKDSKHALVSVKQPDVCSFEFCTMQMTNTLPFSSNLLLVPRSFSSADSLSFRVKVLITVLLNTTTQELPNALCRP